MRLKIKNNHRTKLIVILAVIIGVILVALALFLFLHKPGPTTQQAVDSKGTKAQSSSTTPLNNPGSDKTNDSSAGGTSSKSSVPVVIVDASQNGSTFEVRAYADAVTDGTCNYTFTKGSSTIVKQSAATFSGNTVSCATLDVNTGDFPSKGSWQLTVKYLSTPGDVSGSVSQSVTIE
jgi:hypothetical protein